MQIPISDVDFYERKINRLEKDIASLNQQLNVSRGRLRMAEDFQIKYELLLRQSQQENVIIRKKQEAQKLKLNELLLQQIQKLNKEWELKFQNERQVLIIESNEQSEKFRKQIEQLKRKNKQLQEKGNQVDNLIFRNKKIAKQLQSLQQIIEETKINNERQRQADIKSCKQALTKKYQQKINKQSLSLQQQIDKLKRKCDDLQLQVVRAQLAAKQQIRGKQDLLNRSLEDDITEKLKNELQKLQKLINQKNTQIERLQQQKLDDEQNHANKIREINAYTKQLEDKIFDLQQIHQIELINLKQRMEQIRRQELKQKQKQCEIIQKKHLNHIENANTKLQHEKSQLQRIKRVQQAQIAKLKQDKVTLQKKIQDLMGRLKQHQSHYEIGQTQNLINSLKNLDKKNDAMDDYDNGVTFLEKQLRKAAIKIEKKNAEVKNLILKVSNLTQQFQKQLIEMKQKFSNEIKDLNERIQQLQEQSRQLNQQIRNRDRAIRDSEAQNQKQIHKLKSELRSLNNLNGDLQRDYTRILQSKKVIQKSWRQQRERSISSKSQIAVVKKQNWLELERRKNEIQIIYKEKQEQLKTNYEIIVNDLRVQNDKLKRQKQLIEQELNHCKQKLRNDKQKSEKDDKQNVMSDYQKKLASVELQIALTQNLYNQLIKTKSRVRKVTQQQVGRQQFQQSSKQGSKKPVVAKLSLPRMESMKKEYAQKKSQKQIRQIDQISQEQSHKITSSRHQKSEQPLYFDKDQIQYKDSPSFKMMHSFNPNH